MPLEIIKTVIYLLRIFFRLFKFFYSEVSEQKIMNDTFEILDLK